MTLPRWIFIRITILNSSYFCLSRPQTLYSSTGAPRFSGSVHHTRSTLSPTASTRNCPGAAGVSPMESYVE